MAATIGIVILGMAALATFLILMVIGLGVSVFKGMTDKEEE